MKRTKVDASIEKSIVTAMVVSDEFLAQVVPIADLDLFKADHLREIARWCIKHHQKYRKAPRQGIETIYHDWVAKDKASDEVISSAYDILEDLSTQWEKDPDLNVPYLLDVAAKYFNLNRMGMLRDELDGLLQEGNEESASEAIKSFSAVSTRVGLGIDALNDETALAAAFAESQKPLIKWGNDDADFFFGSALCRDSLIAVLAPEKRGKTWWCVEFAVRALQSRKRVALFEVGDMSQNQIMRRFFVRFSKMPMFKKDLGTIKMPKSIRKDGGKAEIENTSHTTCEHVISEASSRKAIDRFMRGCGIKPGDIRLRVSAHANSSANVDDINSVLSQWEAQDSFVPDVIIIDYPDILASEPGTSGMNSRDQINATWKALRRLSQEKHCLVIAPTQADAKSYDEELLTAKNFSEDKRKLSHVTGMLGLNQTSNEKDDGIMRLNWIVLRESDFSPKWCLHVGQCLTLGRAFCCATL